MRISHIHIQNFRNIKELNLNLGNTVVIVGENNSGKSNFLRAITLPFLAEEGVYSTYGGKILSWTDINDNAKNNYYNYLLENRERIIEGKVLTDEFEKKLPKVCVEVQILPEENERYYVKDIASKISEANNNIEYHIRYEFRPKKVKDILDKVRDILGSEKIDKENIKNVKLNLLPIDFYEYCIFVPGKDSTLPYETLKQYRYMLLSAERDDFSISNERLGSKSLIKLLQMKLNDADKLTVEKKYTEFFDLLKNLSGMDKIINWQKTSSIENAEDFFKQISILPNMPPMSSILNSVKLGYDDKGLSLQGLGYRNIILIFVLLHSLLEKSEDVPLRIIAIEEPEAHLCINNIKLVSGFINKLTTENSQIQTFSTTHSVEFINKLAFENVIVMNNGNGVALREELGQEARDYLSKNPNLDLYKLFFSKKCILVEGLTEEILIRTYFERKNKFSDIEVLSFHKGYKDIIEIWKNFTKGTDRKLGIVRDYDNEEKAKQDHNKLADARVCIKTTSGYTLEDEIVKTNYSLLMAKYGKSQKWDEKLTVQELSKKIQNYKSSIMLQICQDLRVGELDSFEMPKHIQDVISFLENRENSIEN